MRKWKRLTAVILAGMMALSLMACQKSEEKKLLDPENPVTVTVWSYYSGYQLSSFEEMIKNFNSTVGAEEGIVVESVAQGSIDGLVEELNKSVEGKAGAQKIPDVVCVYSDTAYDLDKKDLLLSLDSYYTEKELNAFVDSFLEEGRLTKDGDLKIIPVSKSTELLMYNKTDFDKFAADTGVKQEDMQTMESMAQVAEKYYEWTDAQTPDVKEDGKAFFGWDSLANYVINGADQLGHSILYTDDKNQGHCDLDKETMKKLWDNYYVPYIYGYYGAYGRFRSDDAKVGKLIASVGSSSGVDFFPTTVTLEDGQSHDIEVGISEIPGFKGQKKIRIQQGAGFSVLRSSEKQQYAAVEFLKWMTKKEQNMQFSIGANYMPVLKEALKKDTLQEYFSNEKDVSLSEPLKQALMICAEMVEDEELWTRKPFTNANELRNLIADELQSTASADREKVMEQIQAGASRQEAVQSYLTEEYFDSWYNRLVEETSQIKTK